MNRRTSILENVMDGLESHPQRVTDQRRLGDSEKFLTPCSVDGDSPAVSPLQSR